MQLRLKSERPFIIGGALPVGFSSVIEEKVITSIMENEETGTTGTIG